MFRLDKPHPQLPEPVYVVQTSGSEPTPNINLEEAMRGKVTQVTETLIVTKYQSGVVQEERRCTRVFDVVFNADFKKK